jgi:hypothetical protein
MNVLENKDQLFVLELPDASMPMYVPALSIYAGSAEELFAFADQLEGATTEEELVEIVKAIHNYPDNPNPTYKYVDQEINIFLPLNEVGRKEFLLSDHTWIHTAPQSGNQYLMRARHVWLSYILGERNDCYIQFCKTIFAGLEISTPGLGWVPLRDVSKSFPGMVIYEAGDNEDSGTMLMALHRGEKILSFSGRKPSVDDLPGPLSADLTTGVVEILGRF